ncbi:MAG TPA: membrane protein insertion efficiency factor YidD [Fastidiosipila sp.]|nr:membrane protein insertion efficiency factor YidD [Fastidiosipila sp.]
MARFLISVIRWYQRKISAGRPPTCRFSPTCSQYAIEAIQKRGALIGTAKATWRVLRCNPFGKGGYDPVDKTMPV